MQIANLAKALNYTTILQLAKYSRVRLKEVPHLLDQIETEDHGKIYQLLANYFKKSEQDIQKIRESVEEKFARFNEFYRILTEPKTTIPVFTSISAPPFRDWLSPCSVPLPVKATAYSWESTIICSSKLNLA